jgi:pimeloyl-ACP methyl ester carboxylesterase
MLHWRDGLVILLMCGIPWPALADGAKSAPSEPSTPAGLVLRQASAHPLRYRLALPRGYARQPGKKWPVLVLLCGKSANPFEGMPEDYLQIRGELPCLLAVPCTFMHHTYLDSDELRAKFREYYGDFAGPPPQERLTWDEAGILAMLDDLTANYDAELRAYLCGFSAGGVLTYHLLLTHPERIAAAVTVCGNFLKFTDYAVPSPAAAADAARIPVRILLGENDFMRSMPSRPPGQQHLFLLAAVLLGLGLGLIVQRRTRSWKLSTAIASAAMLLALAAVSLSVTDVGNAAQTQQVLPLLRSAGYVDIEQTLVPGLAHEAAPQQVFEILRVHWAGKK